MENTDSIKTIKMIINLDNKGKEQLSFTLSNKEYSIKFGEEKQEYLRGIFQSVISELKDNKIVFSLDEEVSIKNELLRTVSIEYIDDLNHEIESIYTDLQNLIKLPEDN